jgi:catechol 2,3-dioxygenase-like lactoylglutathione lyase family enzyme
VAGAGFRHGARMEHRVSLITLAATDPQALAKFYASLGWRQVDETPKIVVFDLLGQALGLYERAALAEETGVPAAASGSTVLSHNLESKQLVDDLMARAGAAGATILKPARDAFWGGYHGHFADPEGNVWEIGFNPFSPLGPDGAFQWHGAKPA